MKLSITYAELQDYVACHFQKTVNLGYVDGATVSVSVPIKVLGFTKSISINLIVKKIEGTDLFLSYRMAVRWVLTCLFRQLSLMPKNLCRRRLVGWNRFRAISLSCALAILTNCRRYWKKVELKAIRFTPENIEAEIGLL